MRENNEVRYFVLPRGSPLFHGSEQATGYDVCVRAIVSTDFDGSLKCQRKDLYGFGKPEGGLENRVVWEDGRYVYLLQPGEAVNIGLGIVLGMKPGWTAMTTRRSSTGLADMDLLSEPGMPEWIKDVMGNIFIDSDFRGEPIARLLNLGRKEFPIWHGRRLVQIAFLNGKGVRHPTLTPVRSIIELGSTIRGNGCHGSSGK